MTSGDERADALQALMEKSGVVDVGMTLNILEQDIRQILIYMQREPATIIGAQNAINAWGEDIVFPNYLYDELQTLQQ